MSSDMTRDIFAETAYGRVAMRKMVGVSENFRLYSAKWLNGGREVMEVTGGEFRKAKSGEYKGILAIMVKGTKQSVLVTADEMAEECNRIENEAL